MLTLQDIRDYLATLQDDDIAGITCHARACLLARAWKWKYGQEVAIWNATVAIPGEEPFATLTPYLYGVYYNFDAMHEAEVPVTKKEVLDAGVVRVDVSYMP